MKMYSKVKFLTTQVKVSAKGKTYKISSFLQEGSSGVLECLDETDLALKFGDEIQAVFEYSPKYQSLTFVGIQEAF
jgi:hypothetical protein